MKQETYFLRHLSPIEGTKEKELEKLHSILEMIAIMKDRQNNLKETCSNIFGVTTDGAIKATSRYAEKYNNNTRVIARLKSYYNNTIDKLTKF